MKPVRTDARTGAHCLHGWVVCFLVIGLSGGWTVARTISVSRAAGAIKTQVASIQLKLSRNADAKDVAAAGARPLPREAQASLARDWNLYFWAPERVLTGSAKQMEFAVGTEGINLVVVYRIGSLEQAAAVTEELNQTEPRIRWNLERVSVQNALDRQATLMSLTGVWRARAS